MGSIRLPLLDFQNKNNVEYIILSRRNHVAVQRETALEIFLNMKNYDVLAFPDEDVVPIEIDFQKIEDK